MFNFSFLASSSSSSCAYEKIGFWEVVDEQRSRELNAANRKIAQLEDCLKASQEFCDRFKSSSNQKVNELEERFKASQSVLTLKCCQLETKLKAAEMENEANGMVIGDLEARLNIAQTAEAAAKQRVVDLEKKHQSELKIVSTSLENAIASRKAAERRIVELEQTLELAKLESTRKIASLEQRVVSSEAESARNIVELNFQIEALRRSEEETKLQLATYQDQLKEVEMAERHAEKRIIELEEQLKACIETMEQKFAAAPETAENCTNNDTAMTILDPRQQAGVLLLESARRGDIETVETILHQDFCGVNMVEVQDEVGCRPLMLASKYGHLGVVHKLLEFGAELEARNANGCTALLLAADRGHLDVARLLLDAGANVNTQNNTFYTPLMCATFRGNTPMATLLLKRNAAVTMPAADGATTSVLEFARQCGRGEIVLLLRNRGIRS